MPGAAARIHLRPDGLVASSRTSSRSPACCSPGRWCCSPSSSSPIQLFVTLIEFKLTTLAGFVLIPFGLFGKTAFMAERVLGNVVSSGIKVLVLAVIIGIGSTLFSQFTAGFGGVTPTIDDAMAIVLAALSLLGLGIFGPGIANGLVSGGPQLGAAQPLAPALPSAA
jgi:type IV secretion system protein TrbL